MPLNGVRVGNGISTINWELSSLAVSSPHSFMQPAPGLSTTSPVSPLQLPFVHHHLQHHQQLPMGAVNPSGLLLSDPSDPFNMLSRPTTTDPFNMLSRPAVTTVGEQRPTPVHTIDHTQLKRGRELGQVNRSATQMYVHV